MIFTQACFHFCHVKHKCFLNAQHLIEHSDYSNNGAKGIVFCTATTGTLYDSLTNLFLIALNLRIHCVFASLPPAIFVSSGLIKISSKNVDQFFLSILLVGNLQVEQNPRFPHHLHLHYLTTNHMSCHLQSFWLSYRCS